MNSMKYIAMLLAVAVIGGCNAKPKPKEQAKRSDTFMPADDANRSVWRVFESQTASAAAEDGMLYAHHFAGSELNDLGRDKLDLMLRAENRPMVVYVNVADDTQARQDAVSRFLSAAGLEADAMLVKAGENPAAGAASAQGLARIWKTEGPGPVAGASGESKTLVTPPPGVGAAAGTNAPKGQ